jgi:thiol-disulfide isomerase/thioredoxin
MIRWILFFSICLLLLNPLVSQELEKLDVDKYIQRQEEAKNKYEGFSPTPFHAPDLNGEDHFLSDFKGQVLILQFWQLYCEPCRSQIPSINKLLEDYNDQSVAALGFVDDYGEELADYVNNSVVNYPVIPNARELSLEAFAGELGYPRVFIIDKYGLIRKLIIGGSSYDEMDLYNEAKPFIELYLKE